MMVEKEILDLEHQLYDYSELAEALSSTLSKLLADKKKYDLVKHKYDLAKQMHDLTELTAP